MKTNETVSKPVPVDPADPYTIVNGQLHRDGLPQGFNILGSDTEKELQLGIINLAYHRGHCDGWSKGWKECQAFVLDRMTPVARAIPPSVKEQRADVYDSVTNTLHNMLMNEDHPRDAAPSVFIGNERSNRPIDVTA